MVEENMIRITFDTGETIGRKSCPFNGKYIVKDGTCYCEHPQRQSKPKLECRYGLTEISVPEECPLREKPTIKTIELLSKEVDL